MSPFSLSDWRAMPVTAALGILLLPAGWLWMMASYYLVTQDAAVWKMVISLVLLMFFVLKLKNWARLIALMANIMAIMFMGLWAVTSISMRNTPAALMQAANIFIFGTSTYYLAVRSTADFFKAHSQPGQEASGDGGRS